MVHLTINNKSVSVEEGTTILQAAEKSNIKIPTLCYRNKFHEVGACRICVAEVKGAKFLMASCVTPVWEGMVVYTNTERVRKARKVLYELLLSNHPKDCLSCARNQNCELQELGEVLKVKEPRFEGKKSEDFIDNTSPSIERDMSKCILCRRCVTMCNDVQGVCTINAQNRGFNTEINPGSELNFGTAVCSYCGQCTTVCPVNALYEKDSTKEVWEALDNPKKVVIVQTAPAVRAALGEEFGMEAGTLVTGKMAAALRQMGFNFVFDTNFTADLTILEEGYEFLSRVVALFRSKGAINDEQLKALNLPSHLPEPVLPIITSCSPGWVKYVEHFYNSELDHLSTCKSPHTMLGALTKSWFAQKENIDPKDIYVVSIMPCTAKKYEITRPEMENDDMKNVDAVLTTRELGNMIKEAGIDFENLEDEKFDNPMGISTGAADIFGVTGGVMEAALRTVYEVITGRELPFEDLHVTPIVGLDRIKTASITFKDVKNEWFFLEGVTVKVAVTSGLMGAAQLMEEVKEGKSEYLFIEVMGCPGGCISGGGQPRSEDPEIKEKRLKAIYREDEGKEMRKSHNNPNVIKLYEEFLGHPLGHKSHELLHTTYTKRNRR